MQNYFLRCLFLSLYVMQLQGASSSQGNPLAGCLRRIGNLELRSDLNNVHDLRDLAQATNGVRATDFHRFYWDGENIVTKDQDETLQAPSRRHVLPPSQSMPTLPGTSSFRPELPRMGSSAILPSSDALITELRRIGTDLRTDAHPVIPNAINLRQFAGEFQRIRGNLDSNVWDGENFISLGFYQDVRELPAPAKLGHQLASRTLPTSSTPPPPSSSPSSSSPWPPASSSRPAQPLVYEPGRPGSSTDLARAQEPREVSSSVRRTLDEIRRASDREFPSSIYPADAVVAYRTSDYSRNHQFRDAFMYMFMHLGSRFSGLSNSLRRTYADTFVAMIERGDAFERARQRVLMIIPSSAQQPREPLIPGLASGQISLAVELNLRQINRAWEAEQGRYYDDVQTAAEEAFARSSYSRESQLRNAFMLMYCRLMTRYNRLLPSNATELARTFIQNILTGSSFGDAESHVRLIVERYPAMRGGSALTTPASSSDPRFVHPGSAGPSMPREIDVYEGRVRAIVGFLTADGTGQKMAQLFSNHKGISEYRQSGAIPAACADYPVIVALARAIVADINAALDPNDTWILQYVAGDKLQQLIEAVIAELFAAQKPSGHDFIIYKDRSIRELNKVLKELDAGKSCREAIASSIGSNTLADRDSLREDQRAWLDGFLPAVEQNMTEEQRAFLPVAEPVLPPASSSALPVISPVVIAPSSSPIPPLESTESHICIVDEEGKLVVIKGLQEDNGCTICYDPIKDDSDLGYCKDCHNAWHSSHSPELRAFTFAPDDTTHSTRIYSGPPKCPSCQKYNTIADDVRAILMPGSLQKDEL